MSSLDRRVHPPTRRALLAVATYVAVTEPPVQDAIRTRSAVSDTRRAGNHYRIAGEGRIPWGGAITVRVEEPSQLAERMKRDMLSVYPQIGDPRIDHAWAGLMDYAWHKMPLIGRDGQGQWYATASSARGARIGGCSSATGWTTQDRRKNHDRRVFARFSHMFGSRIKNC